MSYTEAIATICNARGVSWTPWAWKPSMADNSATCKVSGAAKVRAKEGAEIPPSSRNVEPVRATWNEPPSFRSPPSTSQPLAINGLNGSNLVLNTGYDAEQGVCADWSKVWSNFGTKA
mmetsp:Transcript_93768/g.268355  ORF Transcript_93768/g.268355 Transcript_93768/m.268355 type:complete len:118 (-) Transcript_93768:257-610(-)